VQGKKFKRNIRAQAKKILMGYTLQKRKIFTELRINQLSNEELKTHKYQSGIHWA